MGAAATIYICLILMLAVLFVVGQEFLHTPKVEEGQDEEGVSAKYQKAED